MNKKYLVILALVLITGFGGFLRFYKITDNPPSLNNDEVAFGYNAYSILKSARDEYGKFLPLTFKSVGDYKNPVPIYTLVPSIAVFGLNEFGIRFPTALIATLSIPLFYFFLLNLSGKRKIALLGAALISITPWHLFYSRYVSDHLIAMVLLMLATLCFKKMIKSSWMWGMVSGICFVLAMYTYYPERLFVPIFIFVLLILYRRYFLVHLRQLFLFLGPATMLVFPLVISTFFGPDRARATMTFLALDIDFTRYIILDHLKPGVEENFLLFFFWLKRYLNYFQPDFLFFNGLNMTGSGSFGLGILYLFEAPWLLLGVVELVRKKIPYAGLLIAWILIGLVPASLANNEQSAGRSLLILPPVLVLTVFGAFRFWQLVANITGRLFRIGFSLGYAILIVVFLIQAFLIFAVNFPNEREEAFMGGTKQAVLYALDNQSKYKEIVFDPYRGIEAPYIVNIPHMYILFYSQYDPNLYQQEKKRYGQELFGFNKYTVRKIDWRIDRHKAGTLFIGSPWSLPEKDLQKEEILKKIYLSSGHLAFLIVSPLP